MYFGANNLGNLGGEFRMDSRTPFTQELVDARWAEIGAAPPAPIVPEGIRGLYPNGTKTGIMWTDAFGKTRKNSKAEGKKIRDFLNFFNKVAVDPYRKQSGISKVAGGILQVASVALPVLSTMQAVASAGNAGLTYAGAKGDEKLAERVLTPAYEAQAQAEDAQAKADFDAQLQALKTLAPGNVPANFVPGASTAQPVDLTKKPVAPSRPAWTSTEISLAAIVGGIFLLGVMRR